MAFLGGLFGGESDAVENTKVDPNAFQYGGREGAAQEEADYYRQGAQATDARGAPLADYGQADQARAQQNAALGLSRSAAYGMQPSVAQIQQQQGTERAIGDQLAAAASARGTGAGMAAAQRSAQQQGGAMAQQAVAQNAALRAGEMAQARDSFAAQAAGMRGQDQSGAQFQAGQQLQSRGMNDQRALSEEQLRQGVQQAQLGAQQNYAQLQAAEARANAQADQQNRAGVVGAIGDVFSDVRAKQDLSSANGSREAPPSGQEASGAQGVRNSIRAASAAATPEMRSTPVAGSGGGMLGGNAALFGPGGLFGRKSADDSVPTSTMRGAGNAFTGFAQGSNRFSSDQRGKTAYSSDVRAKEQMSPVASDAPSYGPGGSTPLRQGAQVQMAPAQQNIAQPQGQPGGGGGMFGGMFGARPAQGGGGFGGRMQGAGGGMFSDERGKSSGNGRGVADSLLDTLKGSAATYEYKDPSNEPREAGPTGGKYLGVMAQDLERVPQIGPQLVSERGDGMKSVEGGAALSAVMGGLGRITERLERLEQKRKGARRG